MLLTPIYGLPLTDDLDPAADVASHMRQLSTKVEQALQSGGVAAPGAADLLAVSGRVSVLEAMTGPPDSAEIPYGPNFAGYVDSTPWNGLRYWKRGGTVTLAGAIRTTAATSANAIIGTLPTGFRPPATLQVPFSSANTYAAVLANGQVKLNVAAASGFVAALCTATFGAA